MAKRKNQNIFLFFQRGLSILVFLLGVLCVFMLFQMPVLPSKYTIYLVIIFGLFLLLFFLSWKRVQKKVTSIFLFLFLLLYGIGFGCADYYLNRTYHFMEDIYANNVQREVYYVLVDANFSGSLSDIQHLGIGHSELEGFSSALDDLSKKYANSWTEYEDIPTLLNAFSSLKVEGIFIDSVMYELLQEQEDFMSHVKILETIEVSVSIAEEKNDTDILKEPFHVFISGIDTYGSINTVSRSDVNMIMTVNPRTHQILLTSIPRDYYVSLHGKTGYKDKLTHAGIYGINMSVATVEDLFDIDINYYVRVNFTTLLNLVDAIGGIDIVSDQTFTAYTNSSCSFHAGTQHVNGACALAYSRERHAYSKGDRHRVLNQQVVLEAIVNKLTTSHQLITNYSSILNTLSESFQTNMDSGRIYSFVQYQLDQMPKWTFESQSVDGSGASNYTYSMPHTKLYVMIPDMDTVKKAQEKMQNLVES